MREIPVFCEEKHKFKLYCVSGSLTCEPVAVKRKHLQLSKRSQLLGDGSCARDTAGMFATPNKNTE